VGASQSQCRHGGKRKVPAPTRNQTVVIQPIAILFTDRTILAHDVRSEIGIQYKCFQLLRQGSPYKLLLDIFFDNFSTLGAFQKANVTCMFTIEKSNKEELLDEGSEEAILRHRQEILMLWKYISLHFAIKFITY
jgi:hypothetical protein